MNIKKLKNMLSGSELITDYNTKCVKCEKT